MKTGSNQTESPIDWREIFYYDETSPTFLRWKIDVMGGRYHKNVIFRTGSVAGTRKVRKDGYPFNCQVKYLGKLYGVHRIIWKMFYGDITPKDIVDHEDQNPWNNTLSNLNLKSKAENNRNFSRRKDNKTGVTGVKHRSRSGGQYCAQWQDENGVRRTKTFSVLVHGDDEALRLAIECRKNNIERLNEIGLNYSKNHGKEKVSINE